METVLCPWCSHTVPVIRNKLASHEGSRTTVQYPDDAQPRKVIITWACPLSGAKVTRVAAR